MKTQTLFLSSMYTVSQTAIGLVLHPYQTMQSIAREKIFSWLTLFPTFLLALLVVSWRYLALPTAQLFGHCAPNWPFLCTALIFLSDWIVFFCIYWQILLLYLYVRFSRAFRNL